MTRTQTGPQEWQRLAWAMSADDLGTDEPTDETDPETLDWRDWAERTHGARARDFIASADALARIRSQRRTVPAWDLGDEAEKRYGSDE